ncbi:uncharacterized protein LOC125844811 isoform X2 [Solanum stenotomum]|uniref:uncharacterized protein LOC125844811 isoform X2 n=1 Tax=Solanum stenotomum TaxID=172797 RepID=UPI0020D06119|nr:uncharacterized protein LOC125844811 isoform X2 [Solanum stenotomum]
MSQQPTTVKTPLLARSTLFLTQCSYEERTNDHRLTTTTNYKSSDPNPFSRDLSSSDRTPIRSPPTNRPQVLTPMKSELKTSSNNMLEALNSSCYSNDSRELQQQPMSSQISNQRAPSSISDSGTHSQICG